VDRGEERSKGEEQRPKRKRAAVKGETEKKKRGPSESTLFRVRESSISTNWSHAGTYRRAFADRHRHECKSRKQAERILAF
jgi:hypothetical protein